MTNRSAFPVLLALLAVTFVAALALGEMRLSPSQVLAALGGGGDEIARTVHAHPTLSEALMEAAHGVNGEAIHI